VNTAVDLMGPVVVLAKVTVPVDLMGIVVVDPMGIVVVGPMVLVVVGPMVLVVVGPMVLVVVNDNAASGTADAGMYSDKDAFSDCIGAGGLRHASIFCGLLSVQLGRRLGLSVGGFWPIEFLCWAGCLKALAFCVGGSFGGRQRWPFCHLIAVLVILERCHAVCKLHLQSHCEGVSVCAVKTHFGSFRRHIFSLFAGSRWGASLGL
jgi:hypothetical protein